MVVYMSGNETTFRLLGDTDRFATVGLTSNRRHHDDPLVHLAMLNVKVDRRHDRRALSAEEFARLVEARTWCAFLVPTAQ